MGTDASRPRSWCSTAATTACCARSTATAANRPPSRSAASPPATRCGPSWRPSSIRHIKRLRRQHDADQFLRQHLHRAGAQALRIRRAVLTEYRSGSTPCGCTRCCGAAAGRSMPSTSRRSTPTPRARRSSGGRAAPTRPTTRVARSGFEEMGQTWSAPKVMKASGYNDGAGTPTPLPMLIVGGGYDTCEDADPNTCSTDLTPTGQPDLCARRRHRRNGDGVHDRRAAWWPTSSSSRTTRQVWPCGPMRRTLVATSIASPASMPTRKFADTAPANWTMTKIASLGCATASTGCTANRKFMMWLDVVEDLDGSYVILVGSGDREKPLLGFDRCVRRDQLLLQDHGPADGCRVADGRECRLQRRPDLPRFAARPSGPTRIRSDPDDLLAHPKGWNLELQPTRAGRDLCRSPCSARRPSARTRPSCPAVGGCTSNLGTARVYNINYTNAAPTGGHAQSRARSSSAAACRRHRWRAW